MHDRLKSAFDAIHAEDALKESTLAFLSAKAETKQRRTFLSARRLVPALACVLLFLMGLAGYKVYFTPTSIICIDINPSLELGINRFDKIVSVESFNADGEALASQLQIRFMDYSEALEQILSNELVETCLSQDDILSIAIVGDDTTQCSRLLSGVEHCTTGQENAYCYAASTEEVHDAHSCGLSYGKYRAFLELQALDPSVTAEDIQDMTMRQIRDLIAALSETDATNTQATDSEEEASGHHGQGYPGKGQEHDADESSTEASPTSRGNSQGPGDGDGQGNGQGPGNGDGQGSGQGPGNDDGQGNGQGAGSGDGHGNGQHQSGQHRN